MKRLLLIVLPLLLIVGCSKPKELPTSGDKLFNGDIDDIHRVIISQNNNKLMEFINNGENWNVTNESKDYWKTTKQSQSMIIEQFMFSFLDSLSHWKLMMLISSREEKWEKFGVDDFTGRHVIGIDKTDKELFHYIISTKKYPSKSKYIRLTVPLLQDIEQLSNVFTLHYVKIPDWESMSGYWDLGVLKFNLHSNGTGTVKSKAFGIDQTSPIKWRRSDDVILWEQTDGKGSGTSELYIRDGGKRLSLLP